MSANYMIDDLRLIADCFEGQIHDKHRQTIRDAADEIERLERELEKAIGNQNGTTMTSIADNAPMKTELTLEKEKRNALRVILHELEREPFSDQWKEASKAAAYQALRYLPALLDAADERDFALLNYDATENMRKNTLARAESAEATIGQLRAAIDAALLAELPSAR